MFGGGDPDRVTLRPGHPNLVQPVRRRGGHRERIRVPDAQAPVVSVPKISSTSRYQAILVNEAAEPINPHGSPGVSIFTPFGR